MFKVFFVHCDHVPAYKIDMHKIALLHYARDRLHDFWFCGHQSHSRYLYKQRVILPERPALLRVPHETNHCAPLAIDFLTASRIGTAINCTARQNTTTVVIECSYNTPIIALPRNHANPYAPVKIP
jgi:hypothetical protein